MAVTLAAFAERGWEVTAIVDAPGSEGDVNGVQVIRKPTRRATLALYRRTDVVVTQLASRNRAMRWSTATGRPLVHFLRMGGITPDTMLGDPALVVFNAEWLRAASTWSGQTAVLRPPVVQERYRTTPGDHVTLVNLSDRKGGPLFFELARRLPDLRFLGVRGSWGSQTAEDLPNVRLLDPTEDMREVYGQTRVLLMPSEQEPFGRVAIEAACSGIPVVATPLPGIREAIGDAGLYAARGDLERWEAHLRALQDPGVWAERSQLSLQRAAWWSVQDEMSALIDRVAELLD